MAFTIPDRLIDIYQDGIDAIINQLGKTVRLVMPQRELDCPNCGYDGRGRRSNGRYNTNNPNPAGKLNKVFARGQVCPVCNGRGRIKDAVASTISILATTRWDPNEFLESPNGRVRMPAGVCKLKTFASNAKNIEDALEFHVAYDEANEGAPRFKKCKLYRQIAPRGLKYSRYIEFFVRMV